MQPVSPSPEDRPVPNSPEPPNQHTLPVAAEVARGEGVELARLARLARRRPASGEAGTLNASCLLRWATNGKVLAGGRVVKLEVIRSGKRYVSTEAALRRFLSALAAASDDAPPSGDPNLN